MDILDEKGYLEKTAEVLEKRIENYLNARVNGEAKIAAIAFSFKRDLLIKTSLADELIKAIMGEENG